MSGIEPCPFCGKDLWRKDIHLHGISVCQSCFCAVPESVRDTRPVEDGLREELKAMTGAVVEHCKQRCGENCYPQNCNMTTECNQAREIRKREGWDV